MLKIGEKIKELRKSQDITQEKLADYLNISYQAVSKWENGLALPELSLIPALSNFFGVTSDYLLKSGKYSYKTPMLDMLSFSRDNLHANSTVTEFEDWYVKMGHDYKNYFETVISDKRFPILRTRIEKILSDIKKDKRR